MNELHEVITESGLRAPIVWMAGSDAGYQRAAAASEPRTPEIAFHLGAGLLADRDFARAAEAFAMAEADARHGERAVELGAYARAMAGQSADARALAERADPSFRLWLARRLAAE